MSSKPRATLVAAAVAALVLLPAPTTPAHAANDAPSVTWDDDHAFGGWVLDLFADTGGVGWIAAGQAGGDAAAWTSTDGRSWAASSVAQREAGDSSFRLMPTARRGDTLVNLGLHAGFGDHHRIVGWQSTDDGASWETIDATDGIYEDGFAARDAEAGGGVLVVAEWRFIPHSGRLWTYTGPDGWTETTPAEVERGLEFQDVLFSNGTFVVVGTRRAPPETGSAGDDTIAAASWTSTDGVTWTSSTPTPALLGHAFTAVAAMPDGSGYRAVGYDDAANGGDNGRPEAWTSPDGLNWTEVVGPPGAVGTRGELVVAIDGGFLAATTTTDEEGTQTWTSADGDGWMAAGAFDGTPSDLGSIGDEVVLITETGTTQPQSIAYHGTVGPPRAFSDIADSPFRDQIEWLAAIGIARGCTETRFCPKASVTRAQMATFLDRSLDFASTNQDHFTDDEASIHEGAINRLATAGVTRGCTVTRFCPEASVTRAQMASFLDRALDLEPASRDWFTDDNGSSHEDAINRLREAGITFGCTLTRYCPDQPVSREQMAAYLYRALTP